MTPRTAPAAAGGARRPGPGRTAISERVVHEILQRIRAGELTAGARLPPERTLAAELKVSRPTVREALRALSILGVLDIHHGGGVFVSALDPTDLLDPLDFFMSLNVENVAELFDARIHFEPLVTRLAVPRLGEGDLAGLATLVEAQVGAPDDAELFYDTDAEFHKVIVGASGNLFLSRVGRLLQVLGETSRRAFLRRRAIRVQSIEDHTVILAALRAREEEAAADAMRRHMLNVREGWRQMTGV